MNLELSRTVVTGGGDGAQWHTLRRRGHRPGISTAGWGVPIEPGDLYVEVKAVEDGLWGRELLHAGCYDEGTRQMEEWDDGMFYQDIAEGARTDGMSFDATTKKWTGPPSARMEDRR